ncbi:MAG: hypothetical protein ACPGEC_04640 [Flavobacteriales bacterium]
MKKIIALFTLASLLWSCDNDLEIYSENSDLTYVYGLLNPVESDHYVRVLKTVQKEPADLSFDDLYYTDDEITVYLDEFSGNNLVSSIEATPIIAEDKKDGPFPGPKQKYYKIHHDGLYKNPENPNTFSIRVEKHFGDEEIITNKEPFKLEPNLNHPANADDALHFWVGSLNTSKPFSLAWRRASKQSGRETADLNFYFSEENLTTNTIDTVSFSVNLYNDIPIKSATTVSTTVSFTELVAKIKNALGKSESNIKRQFINMEKNADNQIISKSVDIDIWAASNELTIYESFLFSNDGITQDKPNYTNLDNAIGLFSSRFHLKTKINKPYYLSHKTLDSLACMSELRAYNFSKVSLGNDTILHDSSPSRCD